MKLLSCLGDLASILTFLGALGAYIWYRWDACRKSKRLQTYLRDEKLKGVDKGQRSILNIVRYVGLTEDEIIQASFLHTSGGVSARTQRPDWRVFCYSSTRNSSALKPDG